MVGLWSSKELYMVLQYNTRVLTRCHVKAFLPKLKSRNFPIYLSDISTYANNKDFARWRPLNIYKYIPAEHVTELIF